MYITVMMFFLIMLIVFSSSGKKHTIKVFIEHNISTGDHCLSAVYKNTFA